MIQPWADHAACRNAPVEDAELAFAPDEPDQQRFVDAYCHGRSCPVLLECLHASRDPQGVRGGLTEQQRRDRTVKRARPGWTYPETRMAVGS